MLQISFSSSFFPLSFTSQDTQICEEIVTTAFQSWKKTTALERSKIMKKFASLMQDNMEDLATIITLEAGKPLAEARGEVQVRDLLTFIVNAFKVLLPGLIYFIYHPIMPSMS